MCFYVVSYVVRYNYRHMVELADTGRKVLRNGTNKKGFPVKLNFQVSLEIADQTLILPGICSGEYKRWNGLEWNGLLEWPKKSNSLG